MRTIREMIRHSVLGNFMRRSANEEAENVTVNGAMKRENRDIVGQLNRKIQFPFRVEGCHWPSSVGNMIGKEAARGLRTPGNHATPLVPGTSVSWPVMIAQTTQNMSKNYCSTNFIYDFLFQISSS